jgi:pimeloyl-ACP methyl ester carboxylesterase
MANVQVSRNEREALIADARRWKNSLVAEDFESHHYDGTPVTNGLSKFPDTAVEMLLSEADRLGGLINTGEASRAMFNEPGAFSRRFTGHGRPRMPVLVVAGDQDHQIGLEPQRLLAARLPDAEFLVLQDAGHFPHLENPAEFADAIIEFLSVEPEQ